MEKEIRDASGLSVAAETRQISTLLYCLGEEGDDVLSSANIMEEQLKKYDNVMAKFDEHFKVRIFERAKFNKRVQLNGESSEQYITAVYHLADTCNFGNLKEDLICDRLVVGIRDQSLSQQLQMDPDLTIEKAKKHTRKKEAVRQQSDILKGKPDKPISDLEGVRYKHNFVKKRGDQPPVTHKKCTRCGKAQHPRDKCPAKDAACTNFGRGVITAVCVCQRRALQIQHRVPTQLMLVTMMTTVMTIFWEQWTQNRKPSG